MTVTYNETKAMLNSAKQVEWSAEVSISMLMLSQDAPILRIPLLWLHKLLLEYARWHYRRAHRIYARIEND